MISIITHVSAISFLSIIQHFENSVSVVRMMFSHVCFHVCLANHVLLVVCGHLKALLGQQNLS